MTETISTTTARNYNTISPSARWLMLMKGYTKIPFAQRAAKLMMQPEVYSRNFTNKDMTFWARTLHFESRFWSINQLLEGLPVKNILEFSSGFSFRGLEMAKQEGIHYIDTDLPEPVATKKDFTAELMKENPGMEGTYEILPLNVLDEKQFKETVARFPPGEIAMVNEGLLMYLGMNEKEKLCKTIHDILKERGGYWITADVYMKNKIPRLKLKMNDEQTKFFEEHNIEENKFESIKEAEAFFNRMGFVVDKEAKVKRRQLTSLKHLIKSASFLQLFKLSRAGKVNVTWRLRVA